MTESTEQLERRISRHLDGELSDAEDATLLREVMRSSEARTMLDASQRIDGLAREALADELSGAGAASRQAGRPGVIGRIGFGRAAVAAVLVVGVGWLTAAQIGWLGGGAGVTDVPTAGPGATAGGVASDMKLSDGGSAADETYQGLMWDEELPSTTDGPFEPSSAGQRFTEKRRLEWVGEDGKLYWLPVEVDPTTGATVMNGGQ